MRSNGQFPNLAPCRAAALCCRKRFHYEHVLKVVERPFTEPLSYGQGVHETLKRVYDPRNGTPPRERDIEAIARRAFNEIAYPDAESRAAESARCIETVQAYLEQDEDIEATIDVEAFAKLPPIGGTTHPLGLSARFDRLLVRPEAPRHLVVRDYKTGKAGRLDLDGACIMVAVARTVYKAAYETVSLEMDYLNGRGLASRQVITVEQAKSAWPDLKARAVRVYDATEFPPEPGDHCGWCPLQPECQPNRGIEIGSLDDLDSCFE